MFFSQLRNFQRQMVVAIVAASEPLDRQLVKGDAMSSKEEANWEEDLKRRCLARDQTAWTYLVHHYQEPLANRVKSFLGERAKDDELVDEIRARVWEALFEQDMHRLQVFDPGKGSLTHFLTMIAWQQWLNLDCSRRARAKHEKPLDTLKMANQPTRRFPPLSCGRNSFPTKGSAQRISRALLGAKP
jgi:DNA-directed RNA polymerase specialized sigma24 family protein